MADESITNQTETLKGLSDRIAGLSPAKRALLEMRLKKKDPIVPVELTIPRRTKGKDSPLSFSQQRLWFLNQFDPNSAVYNITRATRLSGVLDVEALQKTLDTIVARHEILRTTITSIDGNPVQRVNESAAVKFSVIDLSDRSDSSSEAELYKFLKKVSRRPFDLSSDLMLQATLLRLREKEHVLVLTTHHIASDGWSSGILTQELAALYGAFSAGNSCPLPDLPIQYADFAVWQRQWLQGEVLERQISYWKSQLNKAPAILALPADRPRPTVQSFRGARRPMRLSANLTDALRKLSQREGVTLFMTLLAAFKTLLFRHARQNDIVVGVPVANRTLAETEKLIGFFVNNLVMRTDLSGDPSFRNLLHRVRDVALGAYAHQSVPFEKLVEELHPERSLSHTPLFQVMFGFQNLRRQNIELPGLSMRSLEMENDTAKFDLFLSMVEEVDSVRGSIEYSTDLFDGDTIGRLSDHFESLLQAVTLHPECRLSELPLLKEDEKSRLINWNETLAHFPNDKCIHQLFEEQAERTPDSVAVVFENQQLTYQDLNGRANQLAHYLRKLGVEPEVLAGICMERSLDMIVAVLGVLKAGGAYVPLDPSYPRERLAFMLEDGGVRLLLTQNKLLEGLPGHRARVVCVDSDWRRIASESETNPVNDLNTENLAYVIYTSGSTGNPKGVQVVHRAVANFLNAMRRRPGLTDQDVLVAVTTLSFDIAGLELFLPLSVGARVQLVSTATAADGCALLKVIEDCGATVMQATPATWRLLLEAGWPKGGRLKVLCGGEALPAELAKQLLGRAASVWNLYGPTETTIWSATHRVESVSGGTVSVGRAIDNTLIYILDPRLNLAPIGVAGELCIGGAGLARSYRNRADLTAEKFVPDPFNNEFGARLYKTGDLARYLPDGNIEFLGRIDNQVKIRGFRIELGEIEEVLNHYPGVRQAMVIDRDVAGDKRLIGYFVPKTGQPPTPGELKDFLRKKLPEYMIPAFFLSIENMPLTSNGKVDRNALPDLQELKPEAGNGFLAPRDLVEIDLAKIWGQVLGLRSLGVHDNFFDLGGHSLLAVRLFAEIEKYFNKKLPLATLFEAPTIEQLANLLRQKQWSPSWSSLVAIQPYGSKPPFFCVHAHGGNVLNFNDLARHLGSDQPFYGLQAQGLDGREPKHGSIEEMAAHYLKEIRDVQPNGPYFLGGYCFGGKVAFEMAHQLRAQGQEVALLAVIDAVAPGYRTSLSWAQNRIVQFRFHWKNIAKLKTKEQLSYVIDKAKVAGAKAGGLIKRVAAKACVRAGLALPPRLQGVLKPRLTLKPYSPKVYPGRIAVFSPTESHSGYFRFEPHMGWDRLAAEGVDIHPIPGKVMSIIVEPSVIDLAQQLTSSIERAITPKSQ